MRIDLARNFDIKQLVLPVDRTATVTGSEVDITGHTGSLLVAVSVGAVAIADASNYFTFSMTEDNGTGTGGTFTAVPAAQLVAMDSWDKAINAVGEANSVYLLQLTPSEDTNIVKGVFTETGTAQATFDAVLLFPKQHQPSST